MKVLHLVVMLGIALTLLALVATPLVMTAYFKSGLGITGTNLDTIISAAIFICAIPYVLALFDLKKVCKLIAADHAYSRKIPQSLKRISIYAASEVVIFNIVTFVLCYTYDMYLYALTVLPLIVISIIGASIALLSFVFSNLYKQVIEMKEEHEQTI
ncbi:DUF2975 domain-containing protein [Paenibacillus sp. SC116]|uniref:DUF2975 domain-containing protein n=1 Tax=Paenibacillus sp. SC116 TaxID=2968986 RepID=UPI00215A3A34|nr:DUF2975 domain-containing protein [Paenibacillus sp. SC116]MCR8842697.1 DUF2975 domain-containing protein [Paenibacillus sp. SC116]